ncbi:MAG: hypothetical protein KBF88_02040, partial [Polyangiaceae bacterium]|nr:hypothetical protein [Polyangiaceae bacterium]
MKEISIALGVLQEDPDNESAWAKLQEAVNAESGDSLSILDAAVSAHERRKEFDAVDRILAIRIDRLEGKDALPLLRRRGKLLSDELSNDQEARSVYEKILDLTGGDEDAEIALEESDARRKKWEELVEKYLKEAMAAREPSYKSSLLSRVAETMYSFGLPSVAAQKKSKKKVEELELAILERLDHALELDPSNVRAVKHYERVLRKRGDFEKLDKVLSSFAERDTGHDGTAALVRLARLRKDRLSNRVGAVEACEKALERMPDSREVINMLVDLTDDPHRLVKLYEMQLASKRRTADQEVGILMQIGMLTWKTLDAPDTAEPFFERLRRIEPAHPRVLDFFRAYCQAKGQPDRLVAILQDASKFAKEGDREALSDEVEQKTVASMSTDQAIDRYRAVLRKKPKDQKARKTLLDLYRKSEDPTNLLEFLRSELEKTEDASRRIEILDEMISVFSKTGNTASLVSVLGQKVSALPNDVTTLRQLRDASDKLGRHREALGAEQKLLALNPSDSEKLELQFSIARRSEEQLADLPAAVAGYEAILSSNPKDVRALDRLEEIHTKRRAYDALADLLRRRAEVETGSQSGDYYLRASELFETRLGQEAKALEYAEKAKSLGSLNADAVIERLVGASGDKSKLLALYVSRGAETTSPAAIDERAEWYAKAAFLALEVQDENAFNYLRLSYEAKKNQT